MAPDHYCTGDDCRICEYRITEAEYEREVFPDDYPDYFDGS